MKEISPNRPKRVVIVGGGLSGLLAARYLKTSGLSVELFEREENVGGALRTDLLQNCYLIEKGPMWFLENERHLIELAKEIGISGEIEQGQLDNKKASILWKEKIHNLPSSKLELLKSSLFSMVGRFKLLRAKEIEGTSDESSLASFIHNNLGWEFLERIAAPLINAHFAGDISQMEASAFSPPPRWELVIKNLGEFIPTNFRWGMESIPIAIMADLKGLVTTRSSVENVETLVDRRFGLRLDGPQQNSWADAVIIATPAWASAQLVSTISPELSSRLINFPYCSLTTVHLAYNKKDFKTQFPRRGLFIPREEGIKALAIFSPSLIFENRAPEDEILISAIFGGSIEPEILDLDEEMLVGDLKSTLERYFGVVAEPVFQNISHRNQQTPQFNMGHSLLKKEIEEDLKKIPGLFLTGGYLAGPMLSDTIKHAQGVAKEALKYLSANKGVEGL